MTLSRIVAEFSEERRSPSMAGLPNWRASGTMPGIPEDTSTGTDPGLGPVAELGPEMTETSVGHLTTVQMPLAPAEAETLVERGPQDEPARSERATPVEATTEAPALARAEPVAAVAQLVEGRGEAPSEGALKAERVITIPDGKKAEWAEQIASQVRGGAPAKPLRKSKPNEDPAPVVVAKPEMAKPSSRRDEPTVIRDQEDPEAPPVESRREEKRTELRIGVGAAVLAALISGMLIGRWVWMRDDGSAPGAALSAMTSATMTAAPLPSPTAPSSLISQALPVYAAPSVTVVAPPASATVKPHGPRHSGEPHGAQPAVSSVPLASAPVAPAVTTATPAAPAASVPSGFRPF